MYNIPKRNKFTKLENGKMNKKILIIILIQLLIHSRFVIAQNEPLMVSSAEVTPQVKWDVSGQGASELGSLLTSENENFNALKAEIAVLLDQNKVLETEYLSLQREYEEFNQQVQQLKKEIKKVSPDIFEDSEERDERLQTLKRLHGDIEKLKSDILIKESRNNFLTGQLMDFDERKNLWKLKLSDLEYQRREMQMEVRLKEYELQESDRQKRARQEEIKKQLQKNLEAEEDISKKIEEIEGGRFYSPQKAQKEQMENEQLVSRYRTLAKQKEFQIRENDILKRKFEYVSKAKGGVIESKNDKYDALSRAVNILERKIEKINMTLEKSLKQKKEKTELLQEFVKSEKENQDLRNRISELQEEMNLSR